MSNVEITEISSGLEVNHILLWKWIVRYFGGFFSPKSCVVFVFGSLRPVVALQVPSVSTGLQVDTSWDVYHSIRLAHDNRMSHSL